MKDRCSGEQSSELGDNKRKINMNLEERLQSFLESEARSCSMDYGCITPIYVYRMWGGSVPLNEIEAAMADVRRKLFDLKVQSDLKVER